MGEYLALAWPPGQPGQAAEAMKAAILADGDWRVAYQEFCILVCVRGRNAPRVQVLPRRQGVVIGELYDAQATVEGRAALFDPAILAGLEPRDAATVLTRCAWGSYVALFTPLRAAPWILRDPMGGLECVTWSRDEVTLVASQIPATGPAAPVDLAIDWSRVEAMLHDLTLSAQTVCLRGVEAAAPGVLRQMGLGGPCETLWSPLGFARRAGARRADSRDWRPQVLAERIDACVAALLIDRDPVVAEVSGGLDSSLVGLSLAKAKAPVAAVINHYWPEPQGDERAYAREVAAVLDRPLEAVARTDLVYDLDRLMRCAGGPRPPFNAQDADYDRYMAERLETLGAKALFTGHGGDAVFYQMPTPALARDVLLGALSGQGRGWSLGRRAALALLARRMRWSVWRLTLAALGRGGGAQANVPAPSFMARPARRAAPHPWLVAARGVSAAKRYQLLALANSQLLQGESLRGAVADLVHPLLSQPVVELCLSIPAPILAIGEQDRPHVRAAFAGRLPALIRDRRGKGDVTAVFTRSLAQGVAVLGPFLLEGRLTAAGILDREKLASMLDPDAMIWRDLTGEIMRAVFVEAWVRVWAARLEGRAAPGVEHQARPSQGVADGGT